MIKPNFKDRHQFLKELFAVEMGKTNIKMNKLVYLGKVILELKLMNEFHYDYMQPKDGNKVRL